MSLLAKTIIPNKFWIIENISGDKVGTMSANANSVVVSLDETQKFDSVETACLNMNISMKNNKEVIPAIEEITNDVMGYPVNCVPHNPVWDVQRKIPLFTKNAKSKSFHAAGYYIIKFDHGWAQGYCPKLSTLVENDYQGPFKSKIEMRERLRLNNA